MLGTIILDAYKIDERDSLSNAIDEICSPKNVSSWSSAGIYVPPI